MASHGRALYCGVTRDLVDRTHDHKFDRGSKFTTQYAINKLVWFEAHESPRSAIDREKQIKGWRRETKIHLVEAKNPEWDDLYGSL